MLSDVGFILPCALEELDCETTSLDLYAYIWDYPDNCVFSVLRTEDVNMVKQDRKYYVISGKDSTSKFVFEVKNNPVKHCEKPTPIYPTIYDSLDMARLSEGFDMETGRNLGREKNGATKILQCLGSILGDPDLELEPFTPNCLDQSATPVFSFLSPVSSPSSTSVDPVPLNEQSNP